ncbi:MAG: hypothetical protein M1825_000694 [Sarcosagium campestre]|nr:MAG: hypothetical protein M1825_000694 [Sarcosagium campestre]
MSFEGYHRPQVETLGSPGNPEHTSQTHSSYPPPPPPPIPESYHNHVSPSMQPAAASSEPVRFAASPRPTDQGYPSSATGYSTSPFTSIPGSNPIQSPGRPSSDWPKGFVDARQQPGSNGPRKPSVAERKYVPAHAQPINDAVNSAINREESSGSDYPPDIVAQITAQITEDVLKRLRAEGKDNMAPPAHESRSLSNSQSNASNSPTIPTRSVYTPPSPRKNDVPAGGAQPRPVSQHPVPDYASPPRSPVHSRSPRESTASKACERGPPSPDLRASGPRAPGAPLELGKEETPLERTWGELFDESGRSTKRLGQFLRGLANHLIDDFEPVNSIVVTPKKLAQYYESVRVQPEMVSWNRRPPAALSDLYRELECQHHLVQLRDDSLPTIPGLTPVGFERWMTLLLMAYPDAEVERLQKAVLQMPISNADDHKERFPKEISRRLFPTSMDAKARAKIERCFSLQSPAETAKSAIRSDHRRAESAANAASTLAAKLERDRKPYSATPSESAADERAVNHPAPTNIERARMPYSGTPSESAVEDPLPPGGIERERKPYASHPGGGRSFEDEPKPGNVPSRSNSTSSKVRSHAPPPPRYHDIPPPDATNQHRRSSSIANASSRGGRHRSPSMPSSGGVQSGGDFRRSDNDILGHANIGAPANFEEDRRRHDMRRGDWAQRVPTEDRPRPFEPPRDPQRDRERFDRPATDVNAPRRGYEEDYYRPNGRGAGNGFPPQYR